MATYYNATIEVNVWKEHTCVGCGGAYRYLFKRTKTGQGGNPEAASANARKAVVKALAREVDLQPCPGCGLYQPDMIGTRRSRRHWLLVAAAVVSLAVLLVLAATDVLPFSLASWIAAGIAGALLLAHLLIDASNPNRDLDANQQLARSRVESGVLWVPPDSSPGAVAPEALDTGRGAAHRVACLLFALGALALACAELVRLGSGWPENRGWHPAVAGPGDEVYTYFPDRVSSIKGHWRAAAGRTMVTNGADLGLLGPAGVFKTTGRNDQWGPKISAKTTETNSSSRLWARVHIPADPQLAGKTLQLATALVVEYPALKGNHFENTPQVFTHTATIHLATPRAGSRYRLLFWVGMGGGTALVLFAGVLLARLSAALRRRALPTTIFAPEQPPGPAEGSPPEAGPEVDETPGAP